MEKLIELSPYQQTLLSDALLDLVKAAQFRKEAEYERLQYWKEKRQKQKDK